MLDLDGAICELTDTVLSTYAGAAALPAPHWSSDELPPVRIAEIDLSGDEDCSLILGLPDPLSRRVGGNLFGTRPEELSELDLEDVVREIANAIGGNLKSLLGPCDLSLPRMRLAFGKLDRVRFAMVFECDGIPFRLVLRAK